MTDDELSGETLSEMIKNHGSDPCGSTTCLVEAARNYVSKARRLEDPWGEVMELHVHTSLLMRRDHERAHEEKATRTWYGLMLFYVVEKLGGIVFTLGVKTISDMPGKLEVENYGPDGYVLKTVKPDPKKRRGH